VGGTETRQRVRAIQAGDAAKPPLEVDVIKLGRSIAVHAAILTDGGKINANIKFDNIPDMK
jgi:hypothetical protein